jgi:TonB family protein
MLAIGSAYHLGVGVPKDEAEAYFWLNILASTSNGEQYASLRDLTGAQLTAEKRQAVQSRCRKWVEAPSRNRNDENHTGTTVTHAKGSDNAKVELPQLLAPLVVAPAAMPSLTTQVRKTLAVLAENVTSGFLLSKVQPSYPPLAKQARISGAVVLKAVIGKDGSITDLRALSGHPMLIQAATDAVRQWRYKPYVLEGEPVEVDTQITVNFTLVGG